MDATLPTSSPTLSLEKSAPKQVDVAIAIIFDPATKNILITKRQANTVLAGYWEFPGGKCHAGETPEACAIRETLEETGLTIRICRALDIIEHEYPHARVRLHPFLCEKISGTLQPLAADARWIPPAALAEFSFPEANRTLVATLITHAPGWIAD